MKSHTNTTMKIQQTLCGDPARREDTGAVFLGIIIFGMRFKAELITHCMT